MSHPMPPDGPSVAVADALHSARFDAMDESKPTRVVGIGASAGGLEALRVLVRALHEGSGACFAIAQHLSPSHRSMLVELLARETTLPVCEITDGLLPERDIIYVTPSTCHVRFHDGRFRLEPASQAGTPKPNIDEFFMSLAASFEDRAVGMVLSGTGTDGSRGVRAIHAAGGFTLAQDPLDAKYDGMPRAAIESGCIDFVAPVGALAVQLQQFLNVGTSVSAVPQESDPSGNTWDKIIWAVKRRAGFDLGQYKPSSVGRRIRRRVLATESGSLEAYAELVQRSPQEVECVIREMFISVTQFFRDEEAFAALDHELAALTSAHLAGEELRIWVPGCATGEEAYSLTMLLAEHFERNQHWPTVRVFATDLDANALATARRGVFSTSALSEVPATLASKYFVVTGETCQIAKRLRDMVIFSEHNILHDPAFMRLDMISCRNLLIYLQPKVQDRVLLTFAQALKPKGMLFLGKAEGLYTNADLFAPVAGNKHLYRSRGEADMRKELFRHRSTAKQGLKSSTARKSPQAFDLGTWLTQAHTEGVLAPFVIVDDDGHLMHVFGDVTPFLRLGAGLATLDVLRLAIDSIRLELRSVLLQAQRQHNKRFCASVQLDDANRLNLVTIRREGQGMSSLTMVLFDMQAAQPSRHLADDGEDSQRALRTALEEQLTTTRDHLSTVISELESTNEELQSLNEEMQSANEELQSANEELETSNEELQSTNEELITVNEELESRTAELSLLNTDLKNVKDSQIDPLIVVDEHRRVTLFNPAALQIFALEAASLGSMLFSLPCKVELGDFPALIGQVLATGAVLERQLTGERSYLMRVQPYRGATGEIKGAVLSFHDNTDLLGVSQDLMLAKEKIASAERFSRATINALTKQIGVIDGSGQLVSTNTSWNQANSDRCVTTWGCLAGHNLLDALLQAERAGDPLGAKLLAALRRVMAGEQHEFQIDYAARNDPSSRHYHTVITPFEASGPSHHWVVTHQEITKRVRQEAKVRLQARALNSSLSAISITDAQDPELPLVYVNEAFEAMSGYSANEVLGLNCRFLQGPETNQPALASLRKALAQHTSARVLLRNFRKDGSLFWNELTLSPIFDGGQLTHYVGLQRDMTAILASEEALKIAQERESLALALAGLGGLELDIRAGNATLTEQHSRLLGLPGESRVITMAELRRLVVPSDQHFFDDGFKLCVAGHQGLDMEYRVLWPDGTQHWLHTQGNAVVNEQGVAIRLLALSQDITSRKDAEERVRFIAHHDALTGLPNRTLLRDRMQLALNGARRNRNRLALVFIDLDHFKDVNDALGHEVGDGLLMSVAERLRSCLRDTDTVCRQGGDEFIVLLPNVRDGNDAAHLADKLLAALDKPHEVLGHELHVTCSVGVSLYPEDGATSELLMRHADSAMYHAKGLGRNGVVLFSREMHEHHQDRVSVAHGLRCAIERQELRLHYQPQFDVRSGALLGIEALLRWQHPERGLIYPDSFISVAEESDLIVEIGDWVLREACFQAKRWQDEGLVAVPIAVNISPRQLRQRSIIEKVTSALHDSGLDSRWLELELTERALIHNAETVGGLLADLRSVGVSLALDDFGTGYSSLSYLHRFPVDKLKIDRSFVTSSPTDTSAAAITLAIISLARTMGLSIVAEGVETPEELSFLHEAGCAAFQGYLSGPVSPPNDLVAHVRQFMLPKVSAALRLMELGGKQTLPVEVESGAKLA